MPEASTPLDRDMRAGTARAAIREPDRRRYRPRRPLTGPAFSGVCEQFADAYQRTPHVVAGMSPTRRRARLLSQGLAAESAAPLALPARAGSSKGDRHVCAR